MAKKKGKRRVILFECTQCGERSYASEKHVDNTPDKIEIKKFCPRDRAHTVHKEVTKLD